MSSLVEVVSTRASKAPGWEYVPAARFEAPVSGRRETGGRKRTAREIGGDTGTARSDLSARQRGAIAKHLEALDKENHSDVSIPVPPRRQREHTVKGVRSKTSSNTRKIITSGKQFKNYLAAEEPPTLALSASSTTTAATLSQRTNIARQPETPAPQADTNASRPLLQVPDQPSGLIVSEYDNDPLLRSYIPTAPSERIMMALVTEPPLSYHASRATLPPDSRPPRHFCSICGYWGKVKCIKCQARICGLECSRIHLETRCDRFYA
ncbi:hypothetical protein TESG_02873 [Trichophyton tonsurans CBS 112818]|uniref:HIT-type domain-containing protein n=1 Tax=Trichophyton tonsurans (strain CBS 112818) TaxID=647933 RepID=F2RVN9_TRIT1|nr:hypothetical protein TESG_02873 [Trichophyton tonsurans CBS 112818]